MSIIAAESINGLQLHHLNQVFICTTHQNIPVKGHHF